MKKLLLGFAVLATTTLLACVLFSQIASAATGSGPATDTSTPKEVPNGCPGSTKSAGKDANHPCPDGGKVVNGTYDAPDITCGTPGLKGTSGCKDINGLANFIANWIVGLIAIVAVLMIVISGVQMITSAGSPDAVKAAKSRLTNAIIGLVALIAMRAILSLIGVL